MPEPVLVVDNLRRRFAGRRTMLDVVTRRRMRTVTAVDGISFSVSAGEVFAVVGESGSGKTTTANCVLGLLPPSEGRITIDGADVASLDRRELSVLRRSAQMIFQDPYESLNPRMTVGETVAESLRVHHLGGSKLDRREQVDAALVEAGLAPAELYRDRYPHELSGGQRQRVCIAGALVLRPRLLLADEPVSMLDVSTRAEILNLLARLARDSGLAVVMITHDLSTVAAYSDRLAVMYLGRIVEQGPTRDVIASPQHPYTQALLSVVPVPHPDRRRPPVVLGGETPDPSRIPSGCRFHPRCPAAFAPCPTIDPPEYTAGEQHTAACLLLAPQREGAA